MGRGKARNEKTDGMYANSKLVFLKCLYGTLSLVSAKIPFNTRPKLFSNEYYNVFSLTEWSGVVGECVSEVAKVNSILPEYSLPASFSR